ncbi:MAG: ATP-binding protein [Deltaproteobacteria bacterium]|nr:ATP-binding protein [Deltaproteobacteria bacterium]
MNSSIRNRLLIILLSAVTVAWLLSAITSYFEFSYEVQQLFDAQLEQAAKVILSVSKHEVKEHSENSNAFIPKVGDIEIDKKEFLGHPFKNKIAYQVWYLPDKLITRSASAPENILSKEKRGFSNRLIDENLWRVFSLYDKDRTILVQVGERHDLREQVTNIVAFEMMVPLFILLPTLTVLIWYGIARAMRPMDRLAEQVSSRNPEHLDPILSMDIPREAAPLVNSMNNLFERLSRAFENERQFTSSAAHELRTPLAGLKAQAQLAFNTKDESVGKKALARLIQGVDQSSHLVTQMLTLARLDPETDRLEKEAFLLSKLFSQALEIFAPMALKKEIDFRLVKNEAATIQGDKDSLAILIRNLLDNAIRYSPYGGKVNISLGKEKEYALLRFNDSGPGIPVSAYEKVFERFYRHLGSNEPGSGLGLSIVGRIVKLHNGKIELKKSDLGGLEVIVQIPVIA